MKEVLRMVLPLLPLLLLLLVPGPGLAHDRPHVKPLQEVQEPAETSHKNQSRDCNLPAEVGFCKAAIPMYYYNASLQECVRFTYGGCGGNGNKFETEKECRDSCVPDSSSVKSARMAPAFPQESVPPHRTEISAEEYSELCESEPKAGPCRAAFPRWFYNRSTGSCQSFIYGGCRGNKNNHDSQESCMAACSVKVLPSARKIPGDDDVCHVTPDPGSCRAAFPVYFYEPLSATCQSFLYGGCGGNGNRFGTVEECLSRCSPSNVSEGREQNRWTAAVFLFSTLAVVSVLLLLTLVIISLKRQRLLPRRSSSISDKEELLPDEQSSVDSLSVIDCPNPPTKA